MKYAPKKVYVKENGEYVEIEYDEFCEMKSSNPELSQKCFILIQGYLLEVNENEYKEFSRENNRNQYLRALDIANNVVSTEELINDNEDISDYELCTNEDMVYKAVEVKMFIKRLRRSLELLKDEEREIIEVIYFKGVSQRSYSKQLGIAPSTLEYRVNGIREKLKKLILNY